METKKAPASESLLLPEHQDTSTSYRPISETLAKGLNYHEIVTISGDQHYQLSFDHLANVTVHDVTFNEEADAYVTMVDFDSSLWHLDNEKITMRGFLLPLSHADNYYILSAYPYSRCFFCNQAGIESVLDLKLVHDVPGHIKMDQIITVKGTLEINPSDPYALPYILHDAAIINYE